MGPDLLTHLDSACTPALYTYEGERGKNKISPNEFSLLQRNLEDGTSPLGEGGQWWKYSR